MADGEVLVSEGQHSANGPFIFERLPQWMPTEPAKGNFKLLDVVGRAFDRLDGDLTDLENATTVQHAETVAQIEKLAALVGLPPEDGEGREKYRSRAIAEFQTMTTEATPADVINNTATMLDVRAKEITYKKLTENGAISLGVPGSALDDLALTDSEFVAIIGKHSAAGFRIEATRRGTFTYITPDDYTNNNHDPAKGYDSDSDGDGTPDGDGGTYAGLIE